ncbi:hypothetical protein Ppa06_09390 [Planomonospora parontospora subsp. parontospora]|uniref:PKD domain-containing protein n=2 Tax=Planomonospora parontospora TaxID=58119 RepID=A0AA37BC83_9ACTN|nr:hypothetical protein [Planomonospora parontospora]GGK50260.1 hypothetical protein GCM10010126_07220 [Planomonospora parontospora]GII07141.1 hypothetical protein Ppa06_09390 [Planomonospora parontospora subsp. parontospora]
MSRTRRRLTTGSLVAGLLIPLLSGVSAAPASAAQLNAALVRTVDLSALDPPLPDPSGIAYVPSRDRLLIVDGEVDEMPVFAGSNLFEITRSGTLTDRGLTNPPTKEPVGISHDPGSGHAFIADDDQQRIHDFDPGPDGRFATADDVRTWFSTGAFGSTDPEDVAFHPQTGEIFVLEGTDNDIHRVGPGPNGVFDGVAPSGDDVSTEFDVLGLGIRDPEGIAVHPVRHTLLVADFTTRRVYELNREVMPVNSIDISASGQTKAAGIAVAPATDDPQRLNLYIVDRGVDNDTDPDENDGKMYEMSVDLPPVPNLAPVPQAGRDVASHLTDPLTLRGAVRDDGGPAPVAVAWSQTGGPGTAVFADAAAAVTEVSFSAPGTYVLRLTASDSALSGSDDVTVTVLPDGAPIPLNVPVAKAFDDVEQPPTGYVDWLGKSLNIPNAGGTAQTIGLRFAGLDVPPGSTITSASVQFTSARSGSAATTARVWAVASDDTPTFATTPGSVAARPRTQASVTWSPPAWTGAGQAGEAQRTSELKTLVQEVVDRPGWARGNAIAFVMTGTGERAAQSHDGGTAPVLHLSYVAGGAPPVQPVAFRAAAHFAGNTTSASVGVPSAVQSGDGMLLFATVNTVSATVTGPAGVIGWTLVADFTTGSARTLVWKKVAVAGDAGTPVSLELSPITKIGLQLVAYDGTSAADPVAAVATRSDTTATTSHTGPAVEVGTAGGWLVSYWADKSSVTTAWTPPPGMAVRDQLAGAGSGRVTSLLADSGGTVPIGTAAGPTATTDEASRAAMVRVLLAREP